LAFYVQQHFSVTAEIFHCVISTVEQKQQFIYNYTFQQCALYERHSKSFEPH